MKRTKREWFVWAYRIKDFEFVAGGVLRTYGGKPSRRRIYKLLKESLAKQIETYKLTGKFLPQSLLGARIVVLPKGRWTMQADMPIKRSGRFTGTRNVPEAFWADSWHEAQVAVATFGLVDEKDYQIYQYKSMMFQSTCVRNMQRAQSF